MATGAIVGLTGLVSGGLSAYGANKQAQAAEKASAAQIAEAQAARQQAMELGGIGAEQIRQYGDLAGQQLTGYGAQGIGELMQGRDLAAGQLLGFGGLANQALEQGYGGALGTFEGAAGQARSDLQNAIGGYGQGVNQAMQGVQQNYQPVLGLQDYAQKAAGVADQFAGQSQLAKLMSDPSGYMAQDPGYQYRLQQGEQALGRAQAARGGRTSGRALQELQQHAQGLASQEFGNAANRAQAADAATLQALGQQANIQAGLGQMGYGAQQSMAGQLGQMGMQGAGNLAGLQQGLAQQGMQAGAGLAGLQQQYGGAIAGQQGQMGSQLANLYSGTGAQLGQMYSGLGSNIANLLSGIGAGQANALAGAGAQSASLTQSMLPAYAGAVPYQGGVYGALGNAASNIGSNLAFMSQMGGDGGAGMSVSGQPALGAMDETGMWNMVG